MEEKEIRNYNENHPELEEGEIFLTNIRIASPWDYENMRWVTKRKGNRAYTIYGEALTGDIPVFVQKKEYEEGMKKYE